MSQFNVNKIGPEINFSGVDLSFTNASLFMLITVTTILLFLYLSDQRKKDYTKQITT